MHIFSRLRTWLSIVMSHKCIEVVVALGTIFDEKKVGNMWLGSYSWAAAANIQLPLTVWRKWDWPYSILERLLAAWRRCVWRLGQLEMLFWSTCSIWINTMWAKIQGFWNADKVLEPSFIISSVSISMQSTFLNVQQHLIAPARSK